MRARTMLGAVVAVVAVVLAACDGTDGFDTTDSDPTTSSDTTSSSDNGDSQSTDDPSNDDSDYFDPGTDPGSTPPATGPDCACACVLRSFEGGCADLCTAPASAPGDFCQGADASPACASCVAGCSGIVPTQPVCG